ncbi:MAG: cytochrome c biogenesis protein CcdA [Bacteroidota bacterium]
MKKLIGLLIILFFSSCSEAQILEPAKWSYAESKKAVAIGEEIDLIFKVSIDKKWYVYSSDFDPDCGPIPSNFTFKPNDSYELIGGVEPVNPKKKFDEIFGCEYTYFEKEGVFKQKIKVLKSNLKVESAYEYQVCSSIDGKCIVFDDEHIFQGFSVSGTANPVPNEKEDDKQTAQNESGQTDEVKPEDESEQSIESLFKSPEEEAIKVTEDKSEDDKIEVLKMNPFFDGDVDEDKTSFLWFMVLAFLAGSAALLTPCVFPMIPMTVTFFTNKQGGNGRVKALFYGFSIILIYTLIGALLSPLMGPQTANHLATEWLPNLIFFSVFVIFALSFFGLFEITLPHKFVNSVDRQADKGGFIGVFFMALTLTLVSFSCTGPLVGSLLVESAGGQFLKPILGMFAFSLAFAIPFTLFAIFPSWLNNLPKSGGWLNSVKVVLGFLELAFAFKFLSIADQAFHWRILDREVNIAIWITIFALMGFYLLGKLRLPGDSKLEVIGVPRLILATITFSFVVYLAPGLFGAPLKALAGYLPPLHTHDFDLISVIRDGDEDGFSDLPENCEQPKYTDLLHLPHGLDGYFDLEQAIACAKAQNKPIFVDFTGHGCTNCREMEAVVWSDPRVLNRLKNDYVVVALYVDDKTKLPENDWYISAYDQKMKRTIGKQNADLQIQRANNNAQPNYILLGHNEKGLIDPKAYDRSVDNFVDFLDEGLKSFEESQLQAAK